MGFSHAVAGDDDASETIPRGFPPASIVHFEDAQASGQHNRIARVTLAFDGRAIASRPMDGDFRIERLSVRSRSHEWAAESFSIPAEHMEVFKKLEQTNPRDGGS